MLVGFMELCMNAPFGSAMVVLNMSILLKHSPATHSNKAKRRMNLAAASGAEVVDLFRLVSKSASGWHGLFMGTPSFFSSDDAIA